MNLITDAETVKKFAKAVNTLVSEARIEFQEDKVLVKAVDPSNVAMVVVTLPQSSCDVYTPPEDYSQIGVDVDRLVEILKSAKKKDLIELKIEDNTLNVKVGYITYYLNLLDPNSIRTPPRLPEIEYTTKVTLDGEQFKTAIKTADKISDSIIFRTDEDGLHIETKGDVEKLHIHWGDMDLIDFEKGQAKAMYSLAYLKEFIKTISKGDIVELKLATDYPLWLKFNTAEGKLTVEYILAPRIEEEL